MMRNLHKPLALMAVAAIVIALVVGIVIAAPTDKRCCGQDMTGQNPGCMGCCAQGEDGMMCQGMCDMECCQGTCDQDSGCMCCCCCQCGMMGQQKIAETLNLTTDQKSRMQAIFAEQKNKVQQLMQSSLTPDEKKVKCQELREGMRQQIEAILTPEQLEKAKELWKNVKCCLQQLDLSPEQKEKIVAICKQTMQDMRDIKSDTQLSEQEKMEKSKALRDKMCEQVMSLLTPEQKDKMKQMCSETSNCSMGCGQGRPGCGMNGQMCGN